MDTQIIPRTDKLARYRSSVGLDIFGVIFHDASLRPQVIDGHIYMSLVSLIELIGNSKTGRDPRKVWNDHKKRLKQTDPELSEKIGQLEMTAKDGKTRLTDAADLSTILKIIHRTNTPNARALSDMIDDRVAGMVESAIEYRLMNIAQGSEWAADSIHQTMLDNGLLDDIDSLFDSPAKDMGYGR